MHAVSRARPIFESGLDICAFLFLPILVLASRGTAPLIAVAGLCALGLDADNFAAAWYRVRAAALLLAAMLVWGLLSALWAVQPAHSVLIAIRLAGLFAAGLALVAAASEIVAPRRLACCFATGLAIALVLAVIQHKTNGMLTAALSRRHFAEPVLNQAEDGFGFLLLPLCAMLVLQRRPIVAMVLGVATAAVIFLMVGDTAQTGFVVGVVTAALLYRWRHWLVRAAAAASVILILAAPLVFPALAGVSAMRQEALAIKFSALHRLEIWSFVGRHIAQKPLFGWGLDSSRAIPGGSAEIEDGISTPHQWLPLHPHNSALQVWLELGVPGAALLATLAAWLWLALGRVRWPPLYAAAAGGSLVTVLVVACGSYGIWQEWLVASEFLTLFLILVMARLAQPMPETRSGSIS
jgi:exopolysaccharide production protein ExoQ